MIFKGSGVAIVTPFNKDKTINYEKMEELINFHIANSTDAIIVCGTTGESATLTDYEKHNLIDFTVKKVNKKIPVIAGTGTNDTKKSIELSKYAKNANADGILVVTPYYNKCNQEGLYSHFKEIAKNSSLPLILYNVPSRTNVNIEVPTLIRLSKISNIVGIKEASGNISQIAEMINNVDNNFAVYSGNDDQTFPILSLGGAGVISVAANIIPTEIHDICKYFFDGNIYLSKKIYFKYLDICKKLFIDVNPIPIKEVMNILKYNVGSVRLPLSNLDKKKITILKNTLNISNIN